MHGAATCYSPKAAAIATPHPSGQWRCRNGIPLTARQPMSQGKVKRWSMSIECASFSYFCFQMLVAKIRFLCRKHDHYQYFFIICIPETRFLTYPKISRPKKFLHCVALYDHLSMIIDHLFAKPKK